MNKNEIKNKINTVTLRLALRGTNKGVHTHFHAG